MFAYKMTPYYRHGAQTPWGGDSLKTLFGKPIPDTCTGEALEVSTLPGMESTGPDGRTLTEIAGGQLPLLLKLLDARDVLSVQVHPDDAYAREKEGKLGKAEAWLILHAEPGARLVYGLLPGTDVRSLAPEGIEARLNWMPVQVGDILNIPAGMVHAIGPGIVLYEIQQASDVTYRFYDWNRRDAEGKRRALHWEQAVDVARADLEPRVARGHLETEHFTLDVLRADGRLPLPACPGFAFLTALCAGALECAGELIPFDCGETFFLPRGASGITARATGELVLSGEVIR